MTHDPKAARARLAHWLGRKPLLRPTGRRRLAVLLGGSLLAYAFANAFLYYLTSGQWVSLSLEELTGSLVRPLGDMLLGPLSIFHHPAMIFIVGLTLAVVILVPLMVACLYHSRYCAAFLLCTFLLGHAPVLTLLLALGCVLVAATSLRSSTPVLAVLLGLLPVALYLYVAGRRSSISVEPMERLVLYVPFLVAAVGAMLGAVAMLLIAKIARYRPGVIWPVLAVLLAGPAYLFYAYIGPDELAYALLEQRFTPAEGLLSDQALQTWLPARAGVDSRQSAREVIETDLARTKRQLVRQCDRFLARYPRSPHRPAVLWIKGVAQDTQVDLRALLDTSADGHGRQSGLLRYYDSFPLEQSLPTWEALDRQHGDDPRAGVARLRLAQWAIRQGQLGRAAELLDKAAAVLPRLPEALTPATATAAPPQPPLFPAHGDVPSAGYLQQAAQEAATLQWLMRANHVLEDTDAGRLAAEAFVAERSIDPRQMSRGDYAERIAQLRERFGECYWSDNLDLTAAMACADPRGQVARLRTIQTAAHPDGSPADASIIASYELGRLAMQARNGSGGLARQMLDDPQTYFRQVCRASRNPWQRLAAQYLAAAPAATERDNR